MRIVFDQSACQGHNRCYSLAPELFDVDDMGTAILKIEGDIPAELHEKAHLCADNCPEYAISVKDT